MVGKLEQRYSILLSVIVSNPILYFTYILSRRTGILIDAI